MQVGLSKPLLSKKILVTRATQQASPLSRMLRELGAIPIEFPTIEIVSNSNSEQLDSSIRRLTEYDWIIFTSVQAVRPFMERMAALNLRLESLQRPKVAAIGPSTAAALERAGKKADYVPKEYLSERILADADDLDGKRILLPRADIASKKLPDILRSRGALVDEIIAYRTVIPKDCLSERLKSIFENGVDIVTFTSPSTVRNLAQILGQETLVGLLHGVEIACIGPVTANAAKELAIEADVIAKTHTIDGLVEAIVDEIGTV